MKLNKLSPDQKHKRARAIDFAPYEDEVALLAYRNYENKGSQPGNDLQHWLDAEKQLQKEHRLIAARQ